MKLPRNKPVYVREYIVYNIWHNKEQKIETISSLKEVKAAVPQALALLGNSLR